MTAPHMQKSCRLNNAKFANPSGVASISRTHYKGNKKAIDHTTY